MYTSNPNRRSAASGFSFSIKRPTITSAGSGARARQKIQINRLLSHIILCRQQTSRSNRFGIRKKNSKTTFVSFYLCNNGGQRKKLFIVGVGPCIYSTQNTHLYVIKNDRWHTRWRLGKAAAIYIYIHVYIVFFSLAFIIERERYDI